MFMASLEWADGRKHTRVQNGMQSGRMYAVSGAYCVGRDQGGCSFLCAPTTAGHLRVVCVSHKPQFKHLNHPNTHTHIWNTSNTSQF